MFIIIYIGCMVQWVKCNVQYTDTPRFRNWKNINIYPIKISTIFLKQVFATHKNFHQFFKNTFFSAFFDRRPLSKQKFGLFATIGFQAVAVTCPKQRRLQKRCKLIAHGHLSPQFAIRICGRVNIGIPAPRHQVSHLCGRQSCAALHGRAHWRRPRQCYPCVGTHGGRAVKVARSCWPAQAAVICFPPQQTGVLVENRVNRSGARAGIDRYFVGSTQLGGERNHVRLLAQGVDREHIAAVGADDPGVIGIAFMMGMGVFFLFLFMGEMKAGSTPAEK